MPRGRPRKLQDDGVQTPTDVLPVRSEEVVSPVVFKTVAQEVKARFLPYIGKESLPACVVDKHGRVKKAGESRYFLSGNSNLGYKLIRVYRNGKGIGRSLVRVLKTGARTFTKNKIRASKDRAFLDELRKAGIPGY